MQPCTKGNEPQLGSIQDWSRAANSPLPPFVPPCPREAPLRTPTGFEPCDRHTSERWTKDSFKFPLSQFLWQNGLTSSDTCRCPDADERERLLGFRPDHSRPAMSTSAKIELENARLRLLGSAVHTGLLACLFSVFFHNLQVPAAHQPVPELVNHVSLKASKISTNPGIDIIREIFRRQKRLGPLEHPGALPRSSLRPAWWKRRKVYGSARGSIQESASTCRNFEQLSLEPSGVYGPRQTFSPNGVFAVDSMEILGAFTKGRSASRRLAPLVMKFNSLVVAASFNPLLVYCRTDLNPAEESSRHGQKARRKRLRATIGLLRDRLLAPRTLVKYRASAAAFFSFCSDAGYSKPHTATDMDLRFIKFVQDSWEEGDSRKIPEDARPGLMHFIDGLRGQLHCSQRLLRAWSKNELPMRDDPLPINFFACHGRRCARSTNIANRNVASDRFSRSLDNP